MALFVLVFIIVVINTKWISTATCNTILRETVTTTRSVHQRSWCYIYIYIYGIIFLLLFAKAYMTREQQ